MSTKFEIKYIGREISYKKLRDVILDELIGEDDTIVLNSIDFENLALDYRIQYGNSLKTPHLLLKVLIRESEVEKIPLNRIGILRNDKESVRIIKSGFFSYDGEVIHRCGFCGDVVDEGGKVLEGPERKRAIHLIEKMGAEIQNIYGKCCEKEYS